MRFSTQQLILIVLSAVLLTLAVLRFVFLGRAGFDIGSAVVMIVVALCGIYGAYKLDHLVRHCFITPRPRPRPRTFPTESSPFA